MNLTEAQKLYNQFSINDALTILNLYDFNTNLGNFNLSEIEIEKIWDFTQIIIEKNFNLSEAYNFDTISYGLMAYLEENEMKDLTNNLFPTIKDKIEKNPNYDFIRDIVSTYNDLETKYEI